MEKTRILVLSVLVSFMLVFSGWNIFLISKEHKRSPILPLPDRISREIGQDRMKVQPVPSEKVHVDKDVSLGTAAGEHKIQWEPLALELLGTVIGEVDGPKAFIRDLKTKKHRTCRLGDSIRKARIVRISRDKVVLRRNGQREVLRVVKRNSWGGISPIITQSDGSMLVNKTALLNDVLNLYKTLNKVKLKPHYRSGEVAGLMIDGIDRESILGAAKIRSKDIITTVNGHNIDSYQKAFQVLKEVRNQTKIKVVLLRDGRRMMLTYRIRHE